MAGIAARGRTFDRVDRPRGGQEPVDRRVLGQQVRPDLPARVQAPCARRRRARDARRARGRGEVRARDRGGARTQPHVGQALVAEVRSADPPAQAPRPTCRSSCANARGTAGRPGSGPARGRYRCKRCRVEAVNARRRRVKQILVEEAGGACQLCGYERYAGALQFHHIDPAEKTFALSSRGVARSLAKARAEVAKCVLLCANCHAEVEAGVATIAAATSRPSI